MNIGCVLMASGLGGRFGRNKLLEKVQGIPLYRRAMQAVPSALFARAAVVSGYEEILEAGRALGFLPIENHHAREGISASIRLGLSVMEGMDGALFSVCDQPWLSRESVRLLLAAFAARPDRIAALSWRGVRGNPVIFPRDLFPTLLELEGDAGGGRVIARNEGRLLLVEAAARCELVDIDAPEDLRKP